MKSSCESVRIRARLAFWREARWEFYVHLNLVRSCETPSDPTRCPVPPWVPARLRVAFVLVRLVRLALCPRNLCGSAGFRAAWCSLLLARLDACGLARYLFLFRSHRLRPCAATLYPCKPCASLRLLL